MPAIAKALGRDKMANFTVWDWYANLAVRRAARLA
jgi:hypothetical protein